VTPRSLVLAVALAVSVRPSPVIGETARRAPEEFTVYGETSGGGIRAGHQESLFTGGNAYLARAFPRLDYIRRAVILRSSD
jgi:hypothetical protein